MGNIDKGAEEADRILRIDHADDEVQRACLAFFHGSHGFGDHLACPGIMPPVEPDFGTGRRTRIPLQQLFPDRDSVEWGIGADYLIDGFLPLLQVNQVIFTDDGPEQLLSNPETRLLASLKKRYLQDTLELELRGVYAFERAAWFVYPRVTYRAGDHWRLRLGYLAPGGPLESMIGQFHRNDEFIVP